MSETLLAAGDIGQRIEHGFSPPRPIRVLIADGQALVRAGFHALLESEDDMTIAGEAADGEEAVALAREVRPDVVLMDADLPGMGGLEAAHRIAADPDLCWVRVMILSSFENDDYLFGALRAGATGFLVKDTGPAELVRAVRVLARGDALLAPSVTRRVIAELTSQPYPGSPSPRQLDELTAREREVVALVAAGLSNAEIAERLVVSPATAKTHVSRALMKLHARDRAQLVALAYKTGLVSVGAPLSPA